MSEWLTIEVSAEEYDWLLAKLQEPAKEVPGLRALFEEPDIWGEEMTCGPSE